MADWTAAGGRHYLANITGYQWEFQVVASRALREHRYVAMSSWDYSKGHTAHLWLTDQFVPVSSWGYSKGHIGGTAHLWLTDQFVPVSSWGYSKGHIGALHTSGSLISSCLRVCKKWFVVEIREELLMD